MGDGGDELVVELTRWLAEQRVDAAAAARAREGWLRQQAGGEASLVGVLLDLAERGSPVVLHLRGGATLPGRLGAVADDFATVLGDTGEHSLVSYAAVTAVRPLDPDAGVTGDRPRALDMNLVEALHALLEDRPRLRVATLDGVAWAGLLRSVGRDVAVLRPDGTGADLVVSVANLATVSIVS